MTIKQDRYNELRLCHKWYSFVNALTQLSSCIYYLMRMNFFFFWYCQTSDIK